MGRQKYLKEVESLFERSPVVEARSIERIVKTKQYCKQLIRNLVLKGKIKRLAKGCYTIHDDPSLAVFCFSPAYLGLQDALSFHNLWEQETIPVIITTKKIRPGTRKVLGTNVLVRRIEKKYFFGFEYSKQANFYLPYSDAEKTFVDMIYFKEKLSGEALENLRKKIDWKKLNSYLKVYPNRIRQKALKVLKVID